MRFLVLLAVASIAVACGGSAPIPEPAPEPVVAPTPPPVVEVDPNADLLWYVFWEGIHCLTIYPQSGLIRSEEPHNANATFSSRNDHFSVISVYYEREDEWTPIIEAATSIEDLLERLTAMGQTEVEEALNPVQDSGF
jgi:hypothetical protein